MTDQTKQPKALHPESQLLLDLLRYLTATEGERGCARSAGTDMPHYDVDRNNNKT